MDNNLFLSEKNYECYNKTLEIFDNDLINLAEYILIDRDYLKDCNSVLSNIYKIMTILYGNQVSNKEDYLKLLAYNIVVLTDHQNEKFNELFRPNGKVLSLKAFLSNEVEKYVKLDNLEDMGKNMLSQISNASNNELRFLFGSWSGFCPFVDENHYTVCNEVSDNNQLDIDLDYDLTIKATSIGGNSTTRDTIYDLSCYVEGVKYNTSAYLTTDSIVSNAMSECLDSICNLSKNNRLVREKI